MKLIEEPEELEEYKRIIKELLFNGADRNIRDANEKKPIHLLEEYGETKLEPLKYKNIHRILSP